MVELLLNNVSKTYPGGKTALKNFKQAFSPGITGLLGPNGAGKSTLMNLISTLSVPSAGSIVLNEVDIYKKPEEMRKALGFLPQTFGVFPNLSGNEFLNYIGLIKGLSPAYLNEAIPYYLEVFNLGHVSGKRIDAYSGGMRQRIGIIQALLGEPAVVLLDEPTVGLDPEERINFRNLLNEIATDKIVLLSSHIVSDIETIANQIIVMKEGEMLFSGNSADALKLIADQVFITPVAEEEIAQYRKQYQVTDIKREAGSYLVRYVNDAESSPKGEKVTANLEDVYMYLTGKTI